MDGWRGYLAGFDQRTLILCGLAVVTVIVLTVTLAFRLLKVAVKAFLFLALAGVAAWLVWFAGRR